MKKKTEVVKEGFIETEKKKEKLTSEEVEICSWLSGKVPQRKDKLKENG